MPPSALGDFTIALIDLATALKIAKNARRHHPHLQIFIRAYSRVEAYDYLNGGDVLQQLVETVTAAERATCLYRERHGIGKNRKESI